MPRHDTRRWVEVVIRYFPACPVPLRRLVRASIAGSAAMASYEVERWEFRLTIWRAVMGAASGAAIAQLPVAFGARLPGTDYDPDRVINLLIASGAVLLIAFVSFLVIRRDSLPSRYDKAHLDMCLDQIPDPK